jgi:hypothetical protein
MSDEGARWIHTLPFIIATGSMTTMSRHARHIQVDKLLYVHKTTVAIHVDKHSCNRNQSTSIVQGTRKESTR